MDLSIIIPLFNEEESLPELCEWIVRVCVAQGYCFEIIFVDDGSRDRSWAVIESIANQDQRVRGIRFRRNFGKSAALNEGFHYAQGQVVITMDADLQDSPDEIPELFRLIHEEGYDIISGWKQKRYDPFSKTLPTKLFNWTTSKVSGLRLHDFNCGLKAYRSEVTKALEIYGEMHRYIPVMAKWAGFIKIGEKVVQHRARKYGTTKFGLERFVNGFLDLLTISFVSKFGKKPMHFFGTLGTLFFLIGSAVAVYLSGMKLYHGLSNIKMRQVTEMPLFYFALVAVILGMQLFLAGFLGELVSRSAYNRNVYSKQAILNLPHRDTASGDA
mgnify:CR=1 FL=1